MNCQFVIGGQQIEQHKWIANLNLISTTLLSYHYPDSNTYKGMSRKM